MINGIKVKGAIDEVTRCRHYQSANDRIAIKFYCCGEYFPCFQCHKEQGCGKSYVWPRDKFNQKAILCGNCGNELTIQDYLESSYTCTACLVDFNPGCSLHYHLYFERQ